MATVRVKEYGLSSLPSSWSGGYTHTNDGNPIAAWNDARGIALFGNFVETEHEVWTGTASRIVMNSTGSPFPWLEIDTVFNVNGATYAQVIAGNLAAVISDVLAGNDTVTGSRHDDALIGFAGNDVLIGGPGGDLLDGGLGSNTASYATAAAGVGIDVYGASSGDAQGDTFQNIQNFIGSRFADYIYASDVDNRISGGLGNDTFVGRYGKDTLDGGGGLDTASYDASVGGVRVSLLNPAINNGGEAVGDKYVSIENLAGGSYDDTLYGNNAANTIEGNDYPDANIVDDDKLYGMGGNDFLFGYRGDDVLTGGMGKDTLSGGLGRDIYDFNLIAESVVGLNRDVISNFTHGPTGDDIDLSTIDARTDLSGNQAFTFRGSLAFSGAAGQLRVTDLVNTCLVQADVNGDGTADLEVTVRVASLSASDFIL